MFIFKIETIVVGYPVGMRLIHTYGDLIRVLYVDRQFDLTSCGHCRQGRCLIHESQHLSSVNRGV